MRTMKEIDVKQEKNAQFEEIMRAIEVDAEYGFRLFYKYFGPTIQLAAMSVCKSWDLAEDAVSLVLIKVWEEHKKLESVNNPVGWLRKVSKNTMIDLLRKMKPKKYLPLYDEMPSQADPFEKIEADDAFRRRISFLSAVEQEVITYHFVQHMPFKEISEIMDRPVSSISSIFYRALDRLRKMEEIKRIKENF